jgi:hypothetical protein
MIRKKKVKVMPKIREVVVVEEVVVVAVEEAVAGVEDAVVEDEEAVETQPKMMLNILYIYFYFYVFSGQLMYI